MFLLLFSLKKRPVIRQAFACVIRLGFEPKTHSLEGCCSIQLSYQTIAFRDCKITKFL